MFDRAGIETGVEVIPALAAVEQVVRPDMRHEPRMDFGSVVLGYAGVYSSFLLHAKRASDRYGIPMEDIVLRRSPPVPEPWARAGPRRSRAAS